MFVILIVYSCVCVSVCVCVLCFDLWLQVNVYFCSVQCQLLTVDILLNVGYVDPVDVESMKACCSCLLYLSRHCCKDIFCCFVDRRKR